MNLCCFIVIIISTVAPRCMISRHYGIGLLVVAAIIVVIIIVVDAIVAGSGIVGAKRQRLRSGSFNLQRLEKAEGAGAGAAGGTGGATEVSR